MLNRLNGPRLLRIALVFSGAICLIAANVTIVVRAASLGEAELRSWLGEPLNIRIPVSATAAEDETLETTCLKIAADSEPFSLMRELRVELAGVAGDRFFTLRGYIYINEPYIKLVVRLQCAGQGAISRQYTLLPDPRPLVNPPAGAVEPENNKQNVQRLSGQWVTPPTNDRNRADTLANIAEGVYPKSIKRKARYIAALRALNPNLAALDDNASLPPNTALTLPDLRTLSTTRKVIPATTANVSTVSRSPPPAAPNAAAKSPTKTPPFTPAKPKSPPQQKPRLSIQPTERPAEQPAQSPPPRTAKPAQAAKSTTAPAIFSLKLSGGEIDTARSANVTDEQRAILREKQFLLDADDQIAQFLSLKNAVKQLENRLNQVQLKLDLSPSNASANANTASETVAKEAIPPPVAQTTQPTQRTAETTKTTQTLSPSVEKRTLSSSIWIGSILAALIILAIAAALAVWLSRRKVKRAVAVEAEVAHLVAIEEAKNYSEDESGVEIKPNSKSTKVSPETAAQNAAQNEADDVALAIRRSKGAIDAAPRPPQLKASFDPSATIQLAANSSPPTDSAQGDISTDTADTNSIKFELDNSPNSTVDFLIGDDDVADIVDSGGSDTFASNSLQMSSDKAQTAEARMLRLQYMNERYPELMSNTVSINDADSVINTARHYLEESEKGGAKAIELLSYALEERPQEIHYWLALFEVYRLKSMVAEYVDLANKFGILFEQSVEWRYIRLIGHELAPTNTLFRPPKGGRKLATFDSSVWLIADPEKAKRSDSLAVALRTQLFEENDARVMTENAKKNTQKEKGGAK